MTFTASTKWYPLPGKPADMRQILEPWAKALQAAGVDAQLTTVTWGPEFPHLLLSQRYETLADYEKAAPTRAEAQRPFYPQLGALARQTAMAQLSERIQASPPTPGAKWQQSIQYFPALGKGAELRALLLERGKQLEALGLSGGNLLTQIAGPASGSFTRVAAHASMAAYEERRARLAAESGQSEFLAKVAVLIGRPSETTIRQIIVPYA